MCFQVCVHVHLYASVCVHVCCVSMCVASVCMHVHLCASVCVPLHVCTHVASKPLGVHVCCVRVCVHMHVSLCVAYTCVCCVPILPVTPRSGVSTVLSLQALSGPHYYTWGDHGGILVAIAQGMETNELK